MSIKQMFDKCRKCVKKASEKWPRVKNYKIYTKLRTCLRMCLTRLTVLEVSVSDTIWFYGKSVHDAYIFIRHIHKTHIQPCSSVTTLVDCHARPFWNMKLTSSQGSKTRPSRIRLGLFWANSDAQVKWLIRVEPDPSSTRINSVRPWSGSKGV